jgi:hypothetical protein
MCCCMDCWGDTLRWLTCICPGPLSGACAYWETWSSLLPGDIVMWDMQRCVACGYVQRCWVCWGWRPCVCCCCDLLQPAQSLPSPSATDLLRHWV